MWIFWKLQNQQPCTRTSSRRMWARIYSMISINYHQDKRPVMREMKWIWFSIRCILINWHYSFGWCSIPLKILSNKLTHHAQPKPWESLIEYTEPRVCGTRIKVDLKVIIKKGWPQGPRPNLYMQYMMRGPEIEGSYQIAQSWKVFKVNPNPSRCRLVCAWKKILISSWILPKRWYNDYKM